MQDFYGWIAQRAADAKVGQVPGGEGLATVDQIVKPLTWRDHDPDAWAGIVRRNNEGESAYRIGQKKRKRKPRKGDAYADEGEGAYGVARDIAARPGEDPETLSMDEVRKRLLGKKA